MIRPDDVPDQLDTMPNAATNQQQSTFVTSGEARARSRRAVRASLFLGTGALLSWLTRADLLVFQHLATYPAPAVLRAFGSWYSNWGLFPFYLLFLALLVLGHLNRHEPFKALAHAYLLAQTFGTVLLVHLLKLASGRPRPHSGPLRDSFFHIPRLTEAIHSSFPSSHTVDAMVGAAFVAVLWRGRRVPRIAIAVALLMGLSRILIGKHYVSDVLAGFALGIGIVGIAMHAYLLPRWRAIEETRDA